MPLTLHYVKVRPLLPLQHANVRSGGSLAIPPLPSCGSVDRDRATFGFDYHGHGPSVIAGKPTGGCEYSARVLALVFLLGGAVIDRVHHSSNPLSLSWLQYSITGRICQHFFIFFFFLVFNKQGYPWLGLREQSLILKVLPSLLPSQDFEKKQRRAQGGGISRILKSYKTVTKRRLETKYS